MNTKIEYMSSDSIPYFLPETERLLLPMFVEQFSFKDLLEAKIMDIVYTMGMEKVISLGARENRGKPRTNNEYNQRLA